MVKDVAAPLPIVVAYLPVEDAVIKPLALVVTVAQRKVPGVALTVVKVVAKAPPVVVTSPVRAGTAAVGRVVCRDKVPALS